jgi:hypothetical protein
MEISRDTVLDAVANGAPGNGNRPNLDRRAMDALVNAVEARLREHGAQMERRLADLEAGLAIEMDSLRQQEHTIAARAETALEQANKQWNEQTLSLWQQRKEDMVALRQEFTGFQRQFTTEVTTAVEREVRCQVDAVAGNLRKLVENMAAERLDGLVSELEVRNREIVSMRQRLVENERNVLEFALGMGEWFRELAARMCSPRPSEPQPIAIPTPTVSGT